jgi:hypothetical protein
MNRDPETPATRLSQWKAWSMLAGDWFRIRKAGSEECIQECARGVDF